MGGIDIVATFACQYNQIFRLIVSCYKHGANLAAKLPSIKHNRQDILRKRLDDLGKCEHKYTPIITEA